MTIEILRDIEQGSAAWYKARLGIPTASCFADVLAKGKGGGESLTRGRYLRTLAAEIITGAPGESFTTPAMERGKAMEAEARKLYAFMHDADPDLVGFVRNGRVGCSPDALVGDDGLVEIKTKRGDILIEALLREDVPPEHVAQIQGALWVAEREWCDLVCYWPGMPLVVRRAHRDAAYIARLQDETNRFLDDLDALVERVRRYGEPPDLTAQLRASMEATA